MFVEKWHNDTLARNVGYNSYVKVKKKKKKREIFKTKQYPVIPKKYSFSM
jgi:hypothetical protein